MIISTNIQWVVGLSCDYKEDAVHVSIENAITGVFEEVAVIVKSKNGWPNYTEIRTILVHNLRYNQQLTWPIAEAVCHELHIPYRRAETPISPIDLPSTPLVMAVPQPNGLSDTQIRKAAMSTCFRLKKCLT